MARINLEKMSYSQLAALRIQVDKTMVEKQSAERTALRQQMMDLAREHGLSLDEVLGKGRRGKGTVAIKYRDPKNPANTWTGRGTDAALDGGRHQGRQGQEGRFPPLKAGWPVPNPAATWPAAV